jgi:CRISPR type III-B/RAMP module RAMP protein Cmr1
LRPEVNKAVIQIGALKLRTITHALIGGYNTESRSEELEINEFPRPTSVRGAVRWWFRALLAGALWDAGERNIEEIVKEVKKKVSELMGSTEQSSKIIIRLCYSNFAQIEARDLREVPRIRLLGLGRASSSETRSRQMAPSISCYKPGWEMTLDLRTMEDRIDEEAKRVIFWSAVLYSIFGGIGAITRRGFGALQIKEFKGEQDIAEQISQLYQNPTKEKLGEIVRQALEDARTFLEVRTENAVHAQPPFPLVSTDSDVFRFEFLSVPALDDIQLLKIIGESTLKVNWKRRGESGERYHTWILGLPRVVGNTGYFEDKEPGRRPSAISIKPFKKDENGWTLLKFGFLSKDWPQTLMWRGRDKPKPIKPDIKKAFDEAWENVDTYIKSSAKRSVTAKQLRVRGGYHV